MLCPPKSLYGGQTKAPPGGRTALQGVAARTAGAKYPTTVYVGYGALLGLCREPPTDDNRRDEKLMRVLLLLGSSCSVNIGF